VPAPEHRSIVARGLVVVAAAALLALTAGCGGGTRALQRGGPATTEDPNLLPVGGAVDRTGQAEVRIDVPDNSYEPAVVRVSPGTRVVWVNRGYNQHNVTPDAPGSFPGVPTGELDPRQEAARTMDRSGIHRYHCSLHGSPTKGQRGAVVVDGEPRDDQ
jgi:plastocyanin